MRISQAKLRIQLLVVVAGVGIALSASADYKRDYGSGVQDYNKGDYADAIESLQKAIDEESKAQEQVRIYGMRYEPYLPYFYLGNAKFKNGDCAGALAAWKESMAQGIIQKQDQFSELQANMAQCESMKVDVSRIAKSAEDAIGGLEDNINLFAKLESEKLLSSEWSSRWQPQLAKARDTAQSLKARLKTAVDNTDEAAIKAIQSEAQGAASALADTQGLAVARIDSIRQSQAADAKKQLSDARQSLVQAISAGKSLDFKQGSEQMASLQEQMTTLLSQGASAVENASTSASAYRELAQNINNVSRRYALAEQDWQNQQRLAQAAAENEAAARAAAARRIPPAKLKQVAEAYFAGNYQSAVELSNPDALEEDRAKIQALLFRAAANYKLYILSGEKNVQARQRSEDDIRSIKRLNKNFTPYIAAFSPKFLELFRQTG
jgi:hypothetical protein